MLHTLQQLQDLYGLLFDFMFQIRYGELSSLMHIEISRRFFDFVSLLLPS